MAVENFKCALCSWFELTLFVFSAVKHLWDNRLLIVGKPLRQASDDSIDSRTDSKKKQRI